jgi:hypothetical protein
MFPAGGAGIGLLILRICAAAMLVDPAFGSTATFPLWADVALTLISVSLCSGAFTLVGCIGSGLVQIAMLFCDLNRDLIDFAFSLSVTSALSLLGPGAFSVDGRLFGRRLVLPQTLNRSRR